jgi:putative transcriptional regulator
LTTVKQQSGPALCQASGVPAVSHYEAIIRELVRLLRQERERKGLSNYAVAQESGVSESALSLLEREKRNPSMELLLRVADGIGADLPALLVKAIRAVEREARRSGAASARGVALSGNHSRRARVPLGMPGAAVRKPNQKLINV